jgi:hypothetical protein
MFDNVCVRSTAETVRLRLAGLSGQVFGVSTPSVTGVTVIGDTRVDKAFNVSIKGQPSDLWFSPEQLELLDHAAGTAIRIGNTRLVRNSDGTWCEVSTDGGPAAE